MTHELHRLERFNEIADRFRTIGPSSVLCRPGSHTFVATSRLLRCWLFYFRLIYNDGFVTKSSRSSWSNTAGVLKRTCQHVEASLTSSSQRLRCAAHGYEHVQGAARTRLGDSRAWGTAGQQSPGAVHRHPADTQVRAGAAAMRMVHPRSERARCGAECAPLAVPGVPQRPGVPAAYVGPALIPQPM